MGKVVCLDTHRYPMSDVDIVVNLTFTTIIKLLLHWQVNTLFLLTHNRDEKVQASSSSFLHAQAVSKYEAEVQMQKASVPDSVSAAISG